MKIVTYTCSSISSSLNQWQGKGGKEGRAKIKHFVNTIPFQIKHLSACRQVPQEKQSGLVKSHHFPMHTRPGRRDLFPKLVRGTQAASLGLRMGSTLPSAPLSNFPKDAAHSAGRENSHGSHRRDKCSRLGPTSLQTSKLLPFHA